MTNHGTSDRDDRILRFRPRGPRFGSSPPPPQPPAPGLDRYERSEPEPDEVYRHRMIVNGLAALTVLVLMAAGWWIADRMAQMRKNQDCYIAGMRNCTPIPTAPKPES